VCIISEMETLQKKKHLYLCDVISSWVDEMKEGML